MEIVWRRRGEGEEVGGWGRGTRWVARLRQRPRGAATPGGGAWSRCGGYGRVGIAGRGPATPAATGGRDSRRWRMVEMWGLRSRPTEGAGLRACGDRRDVRCYARGHGGPRLQAAADRRGAGATDVRGWPAMLPLRQRPQGAATPGGGPWADVFRPTTGVNASSGGRRPLLRRREASRRAASRQGALATARPPPGPLCRCQSRAGRVR